MSDNHETYSVMLRVRRITYEDAYVAVPVTNTIMKENEDGTFGLDVDAFVAEALRISNDGRVEWKVESSQREPHPIQMPKPEDRQEFDAYYYETDAQPPI
jgi:hypothetical protein